MFPYLTAVGLFLVTLLSKMLARQLLPLDAPQGQNLGFFRTFSPAEEKVRGSLRSRTAELGAALEPVAARACLGALSATPAGGRRLLTTAGCITGTCTPASRSGSCRCEIPPVLSESEKEEQEEEESKNWLVEEMVRFTGHFRPMTVLSDRFLGGHCRRWLDLHVRARATRAPPRRAVTGMLSRTATRLGVALSWRWDDHTKGRAHRLCLESGGGGVSGQV